ncbi:tetratricopeptide repeat domain 1 [Cochliomyia hominivorax]
MPEITEIVNSDDEYQDAEGVGQNPPMSTTASAVSKDETTKSNAEIVDEIIKQQTNLKLKDDGVEKTDNIASGSKTEKSEENDSTAEYIHEEIDENELAEKEKSMTPEELEANKEKANQMKLDANDLFKNSKAEEAIDLYTEALKICPIKASKERAVLYGNRAAAKIKLDAKKTAIDDCTKAIELWPEYVRALLRRAKLYEHEDKLDEALADYKRVYELDPGQSEAREALVRLPPLIEERNERLKAEMLDKLKDLGNMILKPFGLSTANFQMQKDPNTGSYSINFNQNGS